METRTIVQEISESLHQLADPDKAKILQRFFKTGPGEYGEGDLFLGIQIPAIRALVKRVYTRVSLTDCEQLLASSYHEERMVAVLCLVEKGKREKDEGRLEGIVSFYLQHTSSINNWDLVDLSCYKLLGPWFFTRDKEPLYALARSGDLWKERIAMITTYYFIKRDEYADTLQIAELLLNHTHDLIHKAVGWMLREVGNRAPEVERNFLRNRYTGMPRTMLRYAIEKFPDEERLQYLHGKIT